MSRIFRLPGATTRHPAVEAWLRAHDDALGALARRWFEAMRRCGDDVREILHDGQPTACVEDAAFGYVDAFKAHVNVGFFQGAQLPDPHGLLLGDGKWMRHVKLVPGQAVDERALAGLIAAAYEDAKAQLRG